MPAIHHTQVKKAEKLGLMLSVNDKYPNYVEAFIPQRNTRVYGVSAVEAIAQGEAAQKILDAGGDYVRIRNCADPRLVSLENTNLQGEWLRASGDPNTPHGWLKADNFNWVPLDGSDGGEDHETDERNYAPGNDDPHEELDEPFEEDKPRRINGIATDGGVAYREGTMTPDCPFDEGSDEFEQWCKEWDEAADAATEAEEEAKDKGGSVVHERYRAKYAEAGHPTHCGDWLAVTLNNHCAGKTATDLALFEAICGLNGVDTSKYKRDGIGWQGRIRMTGRNMLARKVYAAGGKLVMPETLGGTLQAPADWMSQQRFKTAPKA